MLTPDLTHPHHHIHSGCLFARLQVLLSVLILLFTQSLSASEQPQGVRLNQSLQILIDPAHTIDIEQVIKNNNLDWQFNTQEIPAFGFSPHAYWVKFELPPSSRDRLLQLDYALLDNVVFYRVQGNDIKQAIHTGDKNPFAQRPILHRDFLFPIKASPVPEQIYLHIRSTSSIQIPLTLWEKETFFEQDQFRFAEHGIYYGIVLVMAFYNFFLFLRLKNTDYLFYVVYVITFALAQLSLTGFAYQFLWPTLPDWNERSLAVITPLIVVAGLMFVSHFLKLPKYYPLIYRPVFWLKLIGLILAILSTQLPYAVMIPYGAALAIVACISILLVSYYIMIRSRYKYAIYFSTAWTVFLVGTVVLAMNKFGLLPRTALTESAAQFGSAIEIILLSFALAERLHDENVRRLRAEKEARIANNNLLEIQQQQNDRLEKEVNERTKALHNALAQVHQLNCELADLSTRDQLTGVRNRRYFDDILDREFRRSRRNQSELSLIMVDIDHFKAVNDQYGHLVGDACLKNVATTLYDLVRRPPDLVCRYGGEELAIVLPETSLKGAVILAERMRDTIEKQVIHIDDQKINLTASFGVSCLVANTDNSADDLIGLADSALYQAKQEGRNRVESHILGEAIHIER